MTAPFVEIGHHTWRFTLPGPPRTKKNSGTILNVGKRRIIRPSEAWITWRDQVRAYTIAKPAFTLGLTLPLNCAAIFYRDRETGDATGYYQGLADILEECGIVENDKHLVSWDGSRLKKDKHHPRVEVTLTWTALMESAA